MALEELATYLQQKGRGHFRDPEATATALRCAAKDSYHLTAALADPLRLVLGTTRATVRTLQRHLVEVDGLIARGLAGIPRPCRPSRAWDPSGRPASLPRSATSSASPTRGALAGYPLGDAGLTWTIRESGHFQAEDSALTKMGNTYLRYYLIEAANSVRLHCSEYSAYFRTKYTQTPKHAHKRVLVLTARKLVRLIDALMRTDTVYHPLEHRTTRKEAPPTMQRPARHERTRSVAAVP